MEEDAALAYKLRCELHGHQEDVRAVAVGDLGVVTSSRDTTIKIWAEEGPAAFTLLHTLSGHAKYVGAVTYAPPGLLPDMPNGAVVSGSFDGVVMVWDAASGAAVHTLRGHQYQVSGVVVLPNGDIASASIDKSIKLWREGKPAGELLGHEGPVLCLAVSEAGELLSGSGDHTLRRWVGKSCAQVYKGHTDTVRSVAVLPGVGFVSASHDCTLRVWSSAGETLAELVGHTAIIYAAAATPAGLIASGSEDNTVRLWNAGGACLQTIAHPGCVWAVAFTPGGDLVSGCSDAVARLWSAAPERQADAETAAGYERLLEQRAAAAAASAADGGGGGEAMAVDGAGGAPPGLPPGVKVAEAFELAQPGAKDGETKLVREADGAIAAYGWDAGRGEWEKIGTVVDAPEPGSISSGRRWYCGREWDHVFDVEMDSGAKLKLALDAGENPYLAADRFLAQHDLPPEFKEQVVKFILDNTGGGRGPAVADLPITGGGCDPFTGGGGGESAAPYRAPAAPAAAPSSYDITGGGADPFTGGGGGATRGAAARQVPASAYLLFDAPPPPEGLRKKLLEFNAALAGADDVPPDARLDDAEAAPGGLLDELLGGLASAVSGGGALSDEALGLAARLLRWPAACLFPGLDVARCLALHPGGAEALAAGAGSMAAPALGGVSGALAAAAVSGLAPPLQTGLRLAVNCFKHPRLRAWALANRELMLDGFAGVAAGGGSKAVRLGLASLLLNYAIAAGSGGAGALGGEGGMQVLSGLEELLGALPREEGEAAHRAVLALGTLLAGGGADMAGLARELGLGDSLARLRGSGHDKLEAALAEVAALMR
ncbi:Plaa [Scenedesmus sp. PABB004]|nr:Plaa [Scenedesmus sp. PABB004]